MRYALLMHYREPAEGEISEEAIAEAREAFAAYGRALASAGGLLSADALRPSAATTTVTCREGGPRVQDGPFAETKEALAGIGFPLLTGGKPTRRARGPARLGRPALRGWPPAG
jgi:hypothetical protein